MTISQYDISNIDRIIAGDGDWFTARLLRLMAHADKENLVRLGRAFPAPFAYFMNWRLGGIPSEYAIYDEIREFVNNSDLEWFNQSTNARAKLVLITSGKDF